MRYDHLPIYKAALDLCVYVETIVRGFEKYHKYTIGGDLRTWSKRILFGIHKANRSYEKSALLEKLVEYCEEFKMLVQLGKALKAFKGFRQFEHLSKLSVAVAKQSQAWYKHFAKEPNSTVGVSR